MTTKQTAAEQNSTEMMMTIDISLKKLCEEPDLNRTRLFISGHEEEIRL